MIAPLKVAILRTILWPVHFHLCDQMLLVMDELVYKERENSAIL